MKKKFLYKAQTMTGIPNSLCSLKLYLFFIVPILVGCVSSEENKSPNIILFVVDDLGWSDPGYMGNTYNSTPHIDQLAKEGTIFTNAYANAPNCAPTRACLMSGQYSPRHGVYTVGSPERGKSIYRKIIPPKNKTELDKNNLTIAEVLQQNGYITAHFGKWHLGDGPTGPLERGFDYNFGGNQLGHPKSYFSPYRNKNLHDGPEGEYLTDRLAQEAADFIELNRDSTFFIYFPFYNVHTPLQAKPDLIAEFENKNCERSKCNATYAAMLQSVDLAINTVYSILKSNELAKNTVIIFTSDNGPYFPASSAEPLRGSKGMLYEGGIRIPMFIWHPTLNGITASSSEPVISIDLFPTLLDIANIEKPDNKLLDGQSLLPILSSKSFEREDLYWHFPAYLERYAGINHIWRTAPGGAMRHDSWKIIEFFEDNRVELYNLKDDPSEKNNVSDQYPEIAKKMIEKLQTWRDQVNAPVPTEPNPNFDQSLYTKRLVEIDSIIKLKN